MNPQTVKSFISKYGLTRALKIAVYHSLSKRQIQQNLPLKQLFNGKDGLEIGGPSPIFQNKPLPIYHLAGNIDNINFMKETVWEGKLKEGHNFHYDKNKIGFQYIREATDLKGINNETYDFVLSSHTLEHTANPILALQEIKRVLKNDGYLLLLLPHKCGGLISDKTRTPTTLTHMIKDYEDSTSEHDLAAMYEIIDIHRTQIADWSLNYIDKFITKAKNNFTFRCLHHHVFTMQNTFELVDYAGFQIVYTVMYAPSDIVVLCQKTNRKNNQTFFKENADWRKLSPYSIDH